MGDEPRYLREYARELKCAGERQFRRRFPHPVLVCVSIVGEIKDEPRWRRRTLPIEGENEYVPMQSILHRVWSVKLGDTRSDSLIVVGQDARCDVVIPEYTISRQHCAFTADPSAPREIKDIGSLNGTKVDDTLLALERSIRIRSGSTVLMGRMKFMYYNVTGLLRRLDHV